MSWEYKRILLHVDFSIASCHDHRNKQKRYNYRGVVINPDIDDPVEKLFDSLGGDGWLLKTAVNLDSGADTGGQNVDNVIEYIFYREKNG